MKYRYIGLVGLLAVLSVSVAGPAEAFLPGMPSLSGWSCAPAHKADLGVTGKLGYLGYNRPLIFNMAPADVPLAFAGVALPSLRVDLPVEGIWAGTWVTGARSERGFAACDPGDGLCFTFGGSWLFPDNKEASEQYIVNFSPTASASYSRTWRPLIQWFTLEAAVSRCAWSNFSLIGGFRWDSFSAGFSDPSLLPVIGPVTDVAAIQLTSFIPYVGAETTWGPVKVGVIGFPWVFGTVVAGESAAGVPVAGYATGTYRNAYFAETFAEFGRQVGLVHLSAFATYTVLHATGQCDVQAPGLTSRPYDFGLDRQNWIVGGKVVVGLNTPL
jgi:hypothetical protein